MGALLRLTLLLGFAANCHGQLVLQGVDGNTSQVSVEDLNKLPQRTVRTTEKGKKVEFTGIPLGEVLDKVAAASADNMQRPALILFVLAEGSDGYKVVFSLSEFDGAITDHEAYVVIAREGKRLSETEGPIRLVIPGDKKPARWVRQLSSLRIMAAN